MKEQLIEFKTAKLAKEKGFNIEGHQYYYDSPKSILWHSIKMEMHNESDNISVEAQSLLQKWLREEHRLIVEIDFLGTQAWDVGIANYKIPYLRDYFKTYEEALEKGLIEALKLIK